MTRRGLFFGATLMLSISASLPAVQQFTPKNPTHAVYSAGACSERYELKVMTRPARGQDPMPALVQEARQAVDQVLSSCSKVAVISVGAVNTRTMDTLMFTMSRDSGWVPENRITKASLIALLEQSGYQAMAGPRPYFTKAYWRVNDGKFEAVYGHGLENRMVASHVERTGNGYRVRGQFYDVGLHESERQCDTNREGYPLWGSFSMSVSTDNTRLPILIKWCAAYDEQGDSDTTEFWDLPSTTQNTKITVTAMSAEFAKLPNVLEAADGDGGPELLIDRDMYRVYATRQPVCESREVDLVYRVNNEARASLFYGDYDSAVANTVSTVLGRRCGEILRFKVNAYSVGDESPWDITRYQFIRTPEGVPYRGIVEFRSEAAERFKLASEKQQFGPCDGPFCEYEGGRYLNAIYRGDLSIVRQIDALHREALSEFNQSQSRQVRRLAGGLVADAYDSAISPAAVQLLPVVANKYMHAYGLWGDACLDAGATTQPYSYTSPVIVETDGFGITTTSGGITTKTTYTLNPEFFPLRDRLATYRGAARSDAPTNLAVKGAIFKGIIALTENGDCRSKAVKQLEANLRKLTNTVMREPGVEPPTAAVRPPIPPRVEKAAFEPADRSTASPVAWNAPVPLPAFDSLATANGSNAAAPNPEMTRQQRMQKLNEQAVAAQKRFQEKTTAIQIEMRNARQNGASQAELMQMFQESQKKMQQAQLEYQQELQRLQQQAY